jgi:glutathionyl-hydroquinone reductase
MSVMEPTLTADGWVYTGRWGTDEKDPLYGFKRLKDLYFKADPSYDGRFTVPMLWDKEKETIVNNESSEIIRMMYTEFDEFVADDRKEVNRPLLPENLKEEIEEMNEVISRFHP